MSQLNLADHAADCRSWAEEFTGRPEKPFLLRLASEFENLAEVADAARPVRDDEAPYFAGRASQAMSAAVRAKHPRARLAHLTMAQRYEALSESR